MPVDVLRIETSALEGFFKANEREALRSFYEFPVIWHEARYGFAAYAGEQIAGAGILRVAASLGHVERLVVDPAHRRAGIGRAIVEQMNDVANYYNCHKMTVDVIHDSAAQRFFEACGYGIEAVLPQHTFKLDVAMMRKYLL